jgi:thiol-disulfide isomerase/thioredoxin
VPPDVLVSEATTPAAAALAPGQAVEGAVTLQSSAGAFAIDAYEASIAEGVAKSVAQAVVAGGVTWYQARDACVAAGKRLCSEEEWLVACTGAPPIDRDRNGVFSDDPIVGRKHPYGVSPQPHLCASTRDRGDTTPLVTGEHTDCKTPEGVFDLEGLTKEWIGVTPDRAAVKGGSYFSKGSARCGYHKNTLALDTVDRSIGFRCCAGEVPVSGHPKGLAGSRLGDQVADWELPLLDGGTLSMAELRGKPTILTFWASWCGPCRAEIPALKEEHSIYASEGLQIIAINVDTNLNAAKAFMTTTPISFPVALDPKNSLRNVLSATTLPTTIYVGRDGVIRQRTTGYSAKYRGELANSVTALMLSKPAE